jgi:hypothetical protein
MGVKPQKNQVSLACMADSRGETPTAAPKGLKPPWQSSVPRWDQSPRACRRSAGGNGSVDCCRRACSKAAWSAHPKRGPRTVAPGRPGDRPWSWTNGIRHVNDLGTALSGTPTRARSMCGAYERVSGC